MPPLSQQETTEVLLDYARDHYEQRVRNAIGRGLYPTAWGCQWSQAEWARFPEKRCLNVWLEQAIGNLRRIRGVS